ncbi:hypothetical protein RUND412_009458 [Rhizina undulata]
MNVLASIWNATATSQNMDLTATEKYDPFRDLGDTEMTDTVKHSPDHIMALSPTIHAPLEVPLPTTVVRRKFLLSRVKFNLEVDLSINRFTRILSTAPYRCQYKGCGQDFAELAFLQDHLAKCMHKVFICCHNLYPSLDAMLNHRRDYGCQLPVPENCIFEDWWVKKGPFVDSFVSAGVKCAYAECMKQFEDLESLREHLSLCFKGKAGGQGSGHRIYTCCGTFFPDQKDISRHWERASKGEEVCLRLWADCDVRNQVHASETSGSGKAHVTLN